MDLDELADWLTQLEEDLGDPNGDGRLPPIRTDAYRAARRRRVARIQAELDQGTYGIKPAELIAEGIIYGPPKWGEAFIDDDGRRVDGL